MVMAIVFEPKEHKYTSIDSKDNINWTSVTSCISMFKEPFDIDTIAKKSSKNKKSKWYGLPFEEIKLRWQQEGESATKLGSWYHDQREHDVLQLNSITREGIVLPVFNIEESNGLKVAPDQKLAEGIYPEHMVYLKSAGLCGQADRIEVVNGRVNIYDYKTNKEIKTESYVNWEGISKKMSGPVSHLDDCNYMHYNLQLSIYMYIILKHNPKLKPGLLAIDHIKFKGELDPYGSRILEYDANYDPIVDEIIRYEMPYLKKEVIDIIKYLKQNAST
jgi:hypothetical protein